MNSETSGDVRECEVGGYRVRARRTDAWDAIVTLLLTLETDAMAIGFGGRRPPHAASPRPTR